jgi:hypothetical protein
MASPNNSKGDKTMDDVKKPGVCGQPCEVYSRVVGYLRPIKQWNKGKKAEFVQRREFRAPDMDDPQTRKRINAAMLKRFGWF